MSQHADRALGSKEAVLQQFFQQLQALNQLSEQLQEQVVGESACNINESRSSSSSAAMG